MAGIKIELPAHFSFNTLIAIRINDLNYGGHVGNDSVLSLLHEARMQFLRHHGYASELEIEGVGLIMSNVCIDFKKELLYGDTLRASVIAGELTRVSFDLFYKLERQTAGGLVLAVAARSGMVCYDYTRKKIAAVPEMLRQKLSQ